MKAVLKNTIIALVLVAIVILLPFVVMMIAGLTPPDSLGVSGGTIKEQTWITFSGAYIGAIIGAIGAIINSRGAQRKDRESKVYGLPVYQEYPRTDSRDV